jgi:hypothetical protein
MGGQNETHQNIGRTYMVSIKETVAIRARIILTASQKKMYNEGMTSPQTAELRHRYHRSMLSLPNLSQFSPLHATTNYCSAFHNAE